jgi:membrane protein YdbS with pleckstrin-like domain
MGKRRPAVPKRKRAPSQPIVTDQRRWVRWLNSVPAPLYLLAAVLLAVLIAAFSAWLEESTRALLASVAFATLLISLTVQVVRDWRDAETAERILNVVFGLLLLGASAANLVRYLLVRPT